MFGSIYTAYTGLLGFSSGLDVLSNNVANMNSPGFKSSEISFRDLVYSYGFSGAPRDNNSSLQIGGGVDTTSTRMKFTQGNFQETGNPLDVAIDGNGFFVLRKDGRTFYTRAGQFEIGNDGVLVEQGSGARVAAFVGGALQDISVAGLQASPPRATTNITFVGNLSRGDTTHTLNSITVYDAMGNAHTFRMTFTNNSNVNWTVEVRDELNQVVGNGTISYQGNGSPATNANTISIVYNPTNAPPTTITLNFGTAGSFSGTTSFSTSTDIAVQSQDGYSAGTLTTTTFDEQGYVITKYSNGQSTQHERLALAWFTDLQSLTQVGKNLFVNDSGQPVLLDMPGSNGLGKLVPQKIELSNVELTDQFTNMVILQRGYQASSQIITVANEMMQQLLDIRGKR